MSQENRKPQETDFISSVEEINKDNILSDAVFDYLFSIKDVEIQQQEIEKCKDIAKSIQKKGSFVERLKAWRDEDRRELQSGKKSNTTQFFGDEEKELKCGDWIADKKGVRKIKINRSGLIETVASPVPIYVSKIFTNRQDKTSKVELTFRNGDTWKTITPARSTISTTQKIVKLSDLNVPITSEIARNTVNYLFDLLRLNEDKIPQQESTSKLGWMRIDKKTGNEKLFHSFDFMPYDTDHLTFDADERFRGIASSIREEGDFNVYFTLLKKIRSSGRIEPRIMVDAAVASLLVEPLNLNPFIVHLFGQTEGGKTVCAMLATSIFADPNPDSGFCGNFKTTQAAIEARADLLNNLPLILDDTAQISQRLQDDFAGMIYTLCSGTGKDRSNIDLGIRRVNTWKNCILTTGEHPLVSSDSQGGAINRVIQIETGNERIFEDGHEVVEIIKKNFGLVGPMIVRAIKQIGFDELNQTYNELFNELKNGKMEKQAQSAAALLVADRIVTNEIFFDNDYLDANRLKPFLKSANEVNEELRCFHWLIGYTYEHDSNFYDDDDPEKKIVTNWGRRDKRNKRKKMLYLWPSVLEDIINQSPYSFERFRKWARNRGILKCEKGRYFYRSRMYPENKDGENKFDTSQKKCYAICYDSPEINMLMKQIEKDSDDIETPDVIPFD